MSYAKGDVGRNGDGQHQTEKVLQPGRRLHPYQVEQVDEGDGDKPGDLPVGVGEHGQKVIGKGDAVHGGGDNHAEVDIGKDPRRLAAGEKGHLGILSPQEIGGAADENLGHGGDQGKEAAQQIGEDHAAAGKANGDAGHGHNAHADDLANGHGKQIGAGKLLGAGGFCLVCHK